MSAYPGCYKYVVEFEKLLVKGNLNGLTIKDRIHFATENDARCWIRDVQKFDKGSNYISFNVKAVA